MKFRNMSTMYIRKTKKQDPKTGKPYFTYQLVESSRTEKGPRQKILLSMGSDIELPAEDLPILAQRIEEIVCGYVNVIIAHSATVETLAQEYASLLINRQANQSKTISESTETPPDYQSIDLETIEYQEPRTVGVEHLLLSFASELNLQKELASLGFSEKEINLALGTIIARAAFPKSERATYEWLTTKSGLGELLGFNYKDTSLDHLYRISDKLFQNKESIEKHLEKAQQNIHGYQNTMILYDLTNTYMEGRSKGNPKAQRGRSKEKRTDCPLITLGLVINEHGFITRSSFLSGNVSEPGTLQKAIDGLSSGEDLFKPTIVMDAGISSEENLTWMRQKGYKYIVSARQDSPSYELEDALVPVGDIEKTGVKAALVKTNDNTEKWLYCESEAKGSVAAEMKKAYQKKIEADLEEVKASLQKPRGKKKYEQVLERIGRLKEKHKAISGCYQIDVKASEDKKTAVEITWKADESKIEDKLNNHYFLRTNHVDLQINELWDLYDSIRTIEDSFRFMKSALGMRPVYHQKEGRVDGHLWITILAYHLIQSCLYRLKQGGIFHHWETVRNRMSGRIRVTMKADAKEGKTLYHRNTTKAEIQQQEIYKALNMTSQISKAKKFFI